MEEFDKIEKLVEKANVTFEEARDALKACNGDLLDAMVYLERLGKTRGPRQSSYSTSYEAQDDYEDVGEKVKDMEAKAKRTSIGALCRRFFDFLWNNSFCVSRNDNELVKLPVWLLVLALIINWKITAAAIIVALFLGCRYAFSGKDDMKSANEFMDKAGDVADHVRESVKNGFSGDKNQ